MHPKEPKKGLRDGIYSEIVKLYKVTWLMVGLTVSIHIRQFKDFNFIPGEHVPGPPKTVAECPTVLNQTELSRVSW